MEQQLARLKSAWDNQTITLLEYVQKVDAVFSQYENDRNVVNELTIAFIFDS